MLKRSTELESYSVRWITIIITKKHAYIHISLRKVLPPLKSRHVVRKPPFLLTASGSKHNITRAIHNTNTRNKKTWQQSRYNLKTNVESDFQVNYASLIEINIS